MGETHQSKTKGYTLIGTAFEKLVNIMAKLRSPEGCPWDREQTHKSLKPYLIEEAYEVLETIEEEDADGLKEELGDLLLQVIFHAQLAKEEGQFTILDVLKSINEKLINRHPHVFGQVQINTADEQRIHWENLKKEERKSSCLDGVPKQLPALLRANRIQQKASTVGFDWEEKDQVWDKVKEEIEELSTAFASKDEKTIEEEFGDLLFSLVNLSRFIRVNPEDALNGAIDKFMDRFQKLEKSMEEDGQNLKDASLEEMDKIWNRIKNEDR
ncbi:nucleoside triphosphate pyrophosphohydrolase [bacterium]|nr:nucleoside triphosphate pyrophosphohydrolase [bacterium]RQV95290.1 MAG: nucleoside triphosphate pyrophosphohydrolase [bacterium]